MNARTTLDIRDLVGIGILDAVFVAVFWTCGMILGPNPLTFPFLTVVTAIPCGIVIMLLLARSPKRGTLAITGLVVSAVFLLTGHWWPMPAAMASKIVADLTK